jgi:hypothetical protein
MDPEESQNIAVDTHFGGRGAGFDLGSEEETDSTAMTRSADADESTDIQNVQTQSDARLPARLATFAKVEKNLASIGYFSSSSRRTKNQKVKKVSLTREIDGKRVPVSAEIHPSAMFGLPVTADQDKYLALQQIITEILQSKGKVTNPIRFKSAELLRLLDTSTKTGNNYKAVSEWLDVMSTTTIISNGAVYLAGRKAEGRDRFRVFERALSFGQTLPDGTVADANYVWLSEWQLENINEKFLMPIDLETYRELKNHIAKALVPLLQIWLFASHKAEAFEKRYSELCEILTLQTYPMPSQILRQFKPSLDELAHHGYIKSWEITKTSDKKAFKIVFFHGPKFYNDRRRRLEQKKNTDPVQVIGRFDGALDFPPRSDDAVVAASKCASPIKEVISAPANLPDVPGHLVDELSDRGVMPSAALKLLGSLTPDRLDAIPDYIEYWDSAKKSGDVGPGFLYELIKNGDLLPAGFETNRQRKARIAAEGERRSLARIEERLKVEYQKYTEDVVDQFIEALPPGDFESRVATHKIAASAQSEFWNQRPELADQFARHAVRADISKEVMVVDFANFNRREFARVSAELGSIAGSVSPCQNANAAPITEPVPQTAVPVLDQSLSKRSAKAAQ